MKVPHFMSLLQMNSIKWSNLAKKNPAYLCTESGNYVKIT